MADRIEDFLVCGDGVLELSGHMEFMPAWMGLALKAAGQDSIRVHKVQDMVEVEPALPDFKARLAGQESDSIALTYSGSLDMGILELVSAAGEEMEVPEAFGFMQKAIGALDTELTVIFSSEKFTTEILYVCYPESLTLLPGILKLEGISLQLAKCDEILGITLRGNFLMGEGMRLYIAGELGMGSMVELTMGSADGTLPSFLDFMAWIAAEMNLKDAFQWFQEGEAYLDAAICAVSISLDIQTLELMDVTAEVKLSLWEIEFDTVYCKSSGTIQAKLWDAEGLDIQTIYRRLTKSGKSPDLPEGMPDTMRITSLQLSIDLEKKRYSLSGGLEDVCQLGPFCLNSLEIELGYDGENGFVFGIRGGMELGEGRELTAAVEKETDGWVLTAGLHAREPVTVGELISVLKEAAPWMALPEFLQDVEAEEFSLEYRTSLGKCRVIFKGKLVFPDNLDLSRIPFVQQVLPESFEYTDEIIRFQYDNGRITEGEILIQYDSGSGEAEESGNPAGEAGKMAEGSGKLTEKEELAPTGEHRELKEDGTGGIHWIEIQKSAGSARLRRAGILFDNGCLEAVVDAGIGIGPIQADFMEMAIGYDFSQKTLTGGLAGLGLSYHNPSFAIEGSIYKAKNPAESALMELEGTVKVKAAKWELSGMASYAHLKDGTASFFVYVDCRMNLGGTPAFRPTGIMGGIAVNRRLYLPEIQELKGFPLMETGKGRSMWDVLHALNGQGPGGRRWMEISPGNYWACAGIDFCSFGLLTGKLLLSVLFGEELQIALLGEAEVTLPKGAKPENAYALIRILMSAVLKPSEGSLVVLAKLADDSYLISRDCHVSGTAAFCIWFGKHSNAGDFVLTIGGYHKDFKRPAHYPVMEPVGFHWQVSSTISAKGEAYMALTPSCIMAGGRLEFLFQEGFIKAWFKAYADMVMYWHPFYFTAEIGVEVGVSLSLNLLFCHKTISICAGADLGLWGPAIGGRVTVHVSIISFTVRFGAGERSGADPIGWDEFAKILPSASEAHRILVEGGTEEEGTVLLQNGDFSLEVETEIPVGTVGIRPMGLGGLQSDCQLAFQAEDQSLWTPEEMGFETETVLSSFPEALWGAPRDKEKPGADLLKGLTSGYRLRPKKLGWKDIHYIEMDLEDLVHHLEKGNPLSGRQKEQETYVPQAREDGMAGIAAIADLEMTEKRNQLKSRMQDFYQGPAGEFGNMKQELDTLYQDCPMYCGKEETA